MFPKCISHRTVWWKLYRQHIAAARALSASLQAESSRLQHGWTDRRLMSSGMDAFLEFEREMAQKRQQTQPTNQARKPVRALRPPIKPKDDECCHMDCPNCVLLQYQEQLLEYESSLQDQNRSEAIRPVPPEPKYMVSFLENEQPSPEQEELLKANAHSLFQVAANSIISIDHKTKDGSVRSVRHIDLHVHDFQKHVVCENASNIAIYVPNDKSIVDQMISHLQVDPDLIFTAQRINRDEDETLHKTIRDRPFAKIGSVRDALTWSFDLVSTPRASFLRKLSAYATSEDDIAAMNTPQILEAIRAERPGKPITVSELFEIFPSIRLTFAAFFQIAPLNPPRYYTVSSSRQFFPDIVSITLGLRTLAGRPLPRCSSYLSVLQPGRDSVRASFLQSSFVFPRNDRRPIMLISVGTGIAPFRAFLQNLEHEKTDNEAPHRLAYLFYGCRDPDVDFLYSDEIHSAQERGILTQLNMAFSDAAGHPRRYVQDALAEQSELLVRHLIQDQGYIYVCGSLAMGRAVKKTITAALLAHSTLSHITTGEAAKNVVMRCLDEKQIVTELW